MTDASTVNVYRVHRFQGSYVCHATDSDMRRYLDHINHGLTANFWSAQPVPHLAPHHGLCVADELAKLDNKKD
jgi:hypothetical protein